MANQIVNALWQTSRYVNRASSTATTVFCGKRKSCDFILQYVVLIDWI
ncbi:hypothetical protein [Umezakia ovalisporum]|uniref:Uncharacterized protein n=2 Tax=Umezakia ovalisporum TaxID=75695 RepID=A0AA43GY41_9CYAN|nr:hypothetical protein [Umezakia ovalisporum]MDH6057270.1 hypothetical protein [Umezakia ovalisporum FSS-43]MDH6063610.1 hypothetical protein [Umezakia ovalisporum FSS-62]MDH6068774.1 hypothetical protein [Umezakia ovalisporum APH033B]MDH6070263.1 hypothetical protein [Umezakia ovalisporum CobakiLakeA]MDH6075720.1 hypothetical protein [Umezakia ovalisporum CS-1034]